MPRTTAALMLGLAAVVLPQSSACGDESTRTAGEGNEDDVDGAGGADASANTTTTYTVTTTYYANPSMPAGGGPSPTCYEDCEAMWPHGASLYHHAVSCIACYACYDTCGASYGRFCAAGSEQGCSATASDCGTCFVSECAQGHDDMGNLVDPDALCAAPVAACLDDQACFDFAWCIEPCG